MKSHPDILPPVAGQMEFVERWLSGSQRKTAYALRQNCEAMIAGHSRRRLTELPDGKGGMQKAWLADAPENLNCTAFLTLTVGDAGGDGFQQVWDAAEASKRINNLNRRVLPDIFEKAIVVTERHKNGAIHFHILGILKGRPDIRTGFDFKAFRQARDARAKGTVNKGAEIRYKLATAEPLRGLWEMMRKTLPEYGFGRAELTPIEKTGEAVACYISKYIEKNVCNRLPEDKRKKLVRYIGWEKGQMKPNEFSWGTPRAIAWRCKARSLAAVAGITEKEQVAKKFGPRWAFKFTGLWKDVFGDDQRPWLDYTPGRYCRVLKELDAMQAVYEKSQVDGFRAWKIFEADFHSSTGRTPEEIAEHGRELFLYERDLSPETSAELADLALN